MGLYSLALFVVTVLLVCVGSASTVAVAAVPVQETEKPSGTTSAKKHLRAAKATDEDNEDRATRIANRAYFAEKLGKLGSRFSKKAKALNARLFPKTSNEMLTTPLISKKHSSSWGLSDDPRWNEKGDSVGKRDPQPMSVLDDPRWNKEEVTRGFDSVGKRDTQPMNDRDLKFTVDDMLDDLDDAKKPMKYVYDLLKMQDDGYKGFDPDKLDILSNYWKKLRDNSDVPSAASFVREAVGSDEKFVLTLESMMKSKQYEWLETEMLNAFGKWKHKKVADVEKLLNEADPHNPRLVKATIERLDKFRKGEIKK